MKLDRTIFKQLINKFLLWKFRKEQQRLCVICDFCGVGFNASYQSGICPHDRISFTPRENFCTPRGNFVKTGLMVHPSEVIVHPNGVTAPREILECTRKAGHMGPCNGWPCESVRDVLILKSKEVH